MALHPISRPAHAHTWGIWKPLFSFAVLPCQLSPRSVSHRETKTEAETKSWRQRQTQRGHLVLKFLSVPSRQSTEFSTGMRCVWASDLPGCGAAVASGSNFSLLVLFSVSYKDTSSTVRAHLTASLHYL